MSSRRRTAAALLVLVVGVGACSSGGGTGALQTIAHSAEATAEAGTARLSFEMSMQGGGIPDGFSFRGEGAFDQARQAGSMTMTMSGGLLPAGEDATFQTVVLDGVVYLNMGALGANLGAPTPWVSFRADDERRMADLLGAGAGSIGNDPSQSLDFLRGVKDAEEVGREEVRGVETTHYRATLSLADALKNLPEDRQRLAEGIAVFGDRVPAEVWLDDENLPRRVRITLAFAEDAPGVPAGVSLILQMELFDFGEPVAIEAPPATEVTDLSAVGAGTS